MHAHMRRAKFSKTDVAAAVKAVSLGLGQNMQLAVQAAMSQLFAHMHSDFAMPTILGHNCLQCGKQLTRCQRFKPKRGDRMFYRCTWPWETRTWVIAP